MTLSLVPSIGYRVNDWLSVGGGVGVTYASLDMELAVPLPVPGDAKAELDGDDVEVGYNLGILLELSERTRLGVTYWSKVDLDFSGDLEGNQNFQTLCSLRALAKRARDLRYQHDQYPRLRVPLSTR